MTLLFAIQVLACVGLGTAVASICTSKVPLVVPVLLTSIALVLVVLR